MNPNIPSSGRVDVADTIRTLATIVRLHEGNRDEQVNALLRRSEDCATAVAELIDADREFDAAMHSEADTDGNLRREDARERRATALANIGAAP